MDYPGLQRNKAEEVASKEPKKARSQSIGSLIADPNKLAKQLDSWDAIHRQLYRDKWKTLKQLRQGRQLISLKRVLRASAVYAFYNRAAITFGCSHACDATQ